MGQLFNGGLTCSGTTEFAVRTDIQKYYAIAINFLRQCHHAYTVQPPNSKSSSQKILAVFTSQLKHTPQASGRNEYSVKI